MRIPPGELPLIIRIFLHIEIFAFIGVIVKLEFLKGVFFEILLAKLVQAYKENTNKSKLRLKLSLAREALLLFELCLLILSGDMFPYFSGKIILGFGRPTVLRIGDMAKSLLRNRFLGFLRGLISGRKPLSFKILFRPGLSSYSGFSLVLLLLI